MLGSIPIVQSCRGAFSCLAPLLPCNAAVAIVIERVECMGPLLASNRSYDPLGDGVEKCRRALLYIKLLAGDATVAINIDHVESILPLLSCDHPVGVLVNE